MRTLPAPRFCLLLIAAGLLALVVGGACAKQKLIPNTKVQDTPINREILRVVEKYRDAVSNLDAAAILTLVHPTYEDAGGGASGEDELDFNGLKQLLRTRFKQTSKVRMRIEYQSVTVQGREATVDTYIDATFVYDLPVANPRWRRLTDFNRFRLIKEGKRWVFVSGL